MARRGSRRHKGRQEPTIPAGSARSRGCHWQQHRSQLLCPPSVWARPQRSPPRPGVLRGAGELGRAALHPPGAAPARRTPHPHSRERRGSSTFLPLGVACKENAFPLTPPRRARRHQPAGCPHLRFAMVAFEGWGLQISLKRCRIPFKHSCLLDSLEDLA